MALPSVPPPDLMVRHFRQILMWPLQLMPLTQRPQQEHWSLFLQSDKSGLWHEVVDEFGDPREFHERHYREFVTFLPHVQRFLYGRGQTAEAAAAAGTRGFGEAPMRVFRRKDIAQIRLTCWDGAVIVLTVQHVDLYFYYDVDVVMLAFEYYADDVPLSRVQDIVYRFGRSYPALWDASGRAEQCLQDVEWLDAEGRVLASSDFADRQLYLSDACLHREARIGRHWAFLLRPLVHHVTDESGDIRFRQIEYHHLPKMTYLALDNPFELTLEAFYRLAYATESDNGTNLPQHEQSLLRFEQDHCYDQFWMPERSDLRASTRIACTSRSLAIIGAAGAPWYADAELGMLGQFRHQYFMLGMMIYFHNAAFLMFSDRMALAISQLDVDDPESVGRFREHIRGTTEIFLRFNHRYWFHEVSKNFVVRDIFRLWSNQLGNDQLFEEVREEVLDMGQYLEGDASRRQNDVVVRLTVVTLLGLVATIATGFLGMNIIDETSQPLSIKVIDFVLVMIPSLVLTMFTLLKSAQLSRVVDMLATEQLSSRDKLKRLVRMPGLQRAAPRSRLSLPEVPSVGRGSRSRSR